MRRTNKLPVEMRKVLKKEPKQEVISFDDAVTLYLRESKIRNLSGYTQRHYKQELHKFKVKLEAQGIAVDLGEITSRTIKDNIIAYMLDRGNQVKTINTLIGTLVSFFNYLVSEGLLEVNPMEKVQKLQYTRRIVETFTKEQIDQLLSVIDKSTFVGVRDETIILLILETGIRVNELRNIRLRDIKWGDNVILITEPKNNKERFVPMQRKMKTKLRKYIEIRGEIPGNDFVFVSIDNEQISNRQIQDHISKYGKLANITDVRCSPHTLRHTMCKMSVMSGANIFALSAVLGHSSLDVTRNYANLFTQDVYTLHKDFSPVENL
ncbi:Tyrosine recombinase XerD [compost metagenome]